ncbi:MAG: GGDEF domain-containing protein [Hyphomicrobiaceae bacterium]
MRYEAVLEMASAARSRKSIDELAMLVSNGWRFCANVVRWRLIGDFEGNQDGELTVITFDGQSTRIETKPLGEMGEATARLWERFQPMRVARSNISSQLPALVELFDVDPVKDVAVLPLDHREFQHRYLLFVASGARGFARLDFKFIDAVGSLFVGELSYRSMIKKLTASLEREARRDELTGLANRRHFMELFEKYWRNASRHQTPLGFVMVDVDHFKKFNDRFGHHAGDLCLAQVSAAMQSVMMRPLDIVARIGGEEFAVLLPDTDLDGAEQLGKRLLAAIDACAIPHDVNGVATTVTASIGVASLVPQEGLRPEDLAKYADDALYDAKNSGRHQVCVYREPTASLEAAVV